ncbi:MAG: RNA polymerase Rpb4 family protein [Methanobacteriota archaeon]
MIGKKILEDKPISSAEAKAVLEEAVKKSKEPNYEQKITLEHLAKFVKMSSEESMKKIEELMKSNAKIKPEIAVKLVDLLPEDEDDVRAIFAKERFALTKEEIAGILKLIR